MSLPLKPDLPPGSTQYAMNLEIANFAAERLVMGQKVEAAKLQVRADNQGYVLRGDVKINGIPALLDYRKDRATRPRRKSASRPRSMRPARTRLGFDLAGSVSGPGAGQDQRPRSAGEGGDSRYSVEADLTQARIDRLLPGWIKPAGRPARMSFIMTTTAAFDAGSTISSIEGPGMLVKGTRRDRRRRRDPVLRTCRTSISPTATRRRCGPSAGPTARCA